MPISRSPLDLFEQPATRVFQKPASSLNRLRELILTAPAQGAQLDSGVR